MYLKSKSSSSAAVYTPEQFDSRYSQSLAVPLMLTLPLALVGVMVESTMELGTGCEAGTRCHLLQVPTRTAEPSEGTTAWMGHVWKWPAWEVARGSCSSANRAAMAARHRAGPGAAMLLLAAGRLGCRVPV
jgi:hypothetical protein